VTVVHIDGADEVSGLAVMVGMLVEQNLGRDPSRHRLLRSSVACLSATDAEVSVTIRTSPGRVEISDGLATDAHVAVTCEGARLLHLTTAPLRFGLPDAFDPVGRAVLGDILSGRVRIRGMVRHPRRVARLASLLSVV
jgi:hypothetical protein